MIIPNKYSGYQAGIRLYPVDGGGGSGGFAQPMTGADYNRRLQAGETSDDIRASQTSSGLFGETKLSDNQFNDIVTQAGMQSPTGRPLAGSAQFYQPVRQTQYQNYANPYTAFNVSTYGTQPMMSTAAQANTGGNQQNVSNAVNTFLQQNPNADMNTMQAAMRGAGMNAYDVQGAGRFNNFGPQMQNPFSTQQPAQPSMFGGQMQGGGYGQFGMNNPFSPFSNSFLNIDQNINQQPVQQQADAYRNAIQSGFGDQQIMNQITGLFGRQNPRDMGFLQGTAMGLTPGLEQGSEQEKIAAYQNARSQGFNDQTIRNAVTHMIGNQTQKDFGYLQNQAGFGGGFGGFGNQFMPRMQTPFQQPMQFMPQQQFRQPMQFQQPMQQFQQPMQQFAPQMQQPMPQTFTPQRSASTPARSFVSRSSQMRRTPNVMRRAEGGITSLLDKK